MLNAIKSNHVFSEEIDEDALPMTITKSREVRFQPIYGIIWFIVDLLMSHKFCGVNLIGRSWRTWENKPAGTHVLLR